MRIVTSTVENLLDFFEIISGFDAQEPIVEEYAATTEQEIQMMADIQQAFDDDSTDVSGLSNGTTYDGVVKMHNESNGVGSYCSGVTLVGS